MSKVTGCISEVNVQDTLRSEVKSKRLACLDIQRGLIMALMAFSHSHEYIGEPYSNTDPGISPSWLGHSYLDIFQQIAASIYVAAGFYMLMGIGMVFLWQARSRQGWQPKQIAHYFFIRGLVMIALQMTFLQLFQFISTGAFFIYAGVLMSLGLCMIATAAIMWLMAILRQHQWIKTEASELGVYTALILGLLLLCNLWMHHIDIHNMGFWALNILVGGEYVTRFHLAVNINFTALPWLPAVLFGIIIGHFTLKDLNKNLALLRNIALGMIALWLFLRYGLLAGWFTFGDFKVPLIHESLNWMAYFGMSKYPPCIDYFLFVLGANLATIVLWAKIESHRSHWLNWLNPLQKFGQCALFFFVCHWFVYLAIASLLPAKLESSTGIIACWLLGLVILYPICRVFHDFKMRQDADSLWRML